MRVLPMACECVQNGQNGEAAAGGLHRAGLVPHRAQLLQRCCHHRHIAAHSFLPGDELSPEASQAAAGSLWGSFSWVPAILGGEATPADDRTGTEIWAPLARPTGFTSRLVFFQLRFFLLISRSPSMMYTKYKWFQIASFFNTPDASLKEYQNLLHNLCINNLPEHSLTFENVFLEQIETPHRCLGRWKIKYRYRIYLVHVMACRLRQLDSDFQVSTRE